RVRVGTRGGEGVRNPHTDGRLLDSLAAGAQCLEKQRDSVGRARARAREFGEKVIEYGRAELLKALRGLDGGCADLMDVAAAIEERSAHFGTEPAQITERRDREAAQMPRELAIAARKQRGQDVSLELVVYHGWALPRELSERGHNSPTERRIA